MKKQSKHLTKLFVLVSLLISVLFLQAGCISYSHSGNSLFIISEENESSPFIDFYNLGSIDS